MKEVWVLKQTVLRARDEQGLQRSLHSFEKALRLREGAIVDVERAAAQRDERPVAVIRYEIPLLAPAGTERERRRAQSSREPI
ncbi:MAG: hypothetical protein RL685_1016 [Pseudomonadota bacterium]|jgi:hypothetical protein